MEKTGNKILDMLQENNLITEDEVMLEEATETEVDTTDAEDLEEDIVVEDADADVDTDEDDDIDLEEEVIDLAEGDDPAEDEAPLDEDVMNILNIVESVTAAYAEKEEVIEE